ncbi:MAG: hypothetical protein ACKERG_00230 [Candidatus Hodgkinia cicadicola]
MLLQRREGEGGREAKREIERPHTSRRSVPREDDVLLKYCSFESKTEEWFTKVCAIR